MEKDYSKLFNQYLQHSNEKKKAIAAIHKFFLQKKFGKNKFCNLLDIGCGTGILLKPFSKHFKHIIAIDRKDRLDKRSRNNPDIKFYKKDWRNFKTNIKFDCVLLAYVLWEIPYRLWDMLFKKLKGMLTKRGFVIVIDAYPETRFDNPFFNFNLYPNNKKTYPDWYEFLKAKQYQYTSCPFSSQIMSKDERRMYEILRFFFQDKNTRDIYKKHKERIIADLRSKKIRNKIIIGMPHRIDCIYL